MIIVKNWGFIARGDAYCPPELRFLALSGEVDAGADPRFNKPGRVNTSKIVGGKGRLIYTASGSVYKLAGPPMKEYRAWLKQKGYKYDGRNPLKSYAAQQFGPEHELVKGN